MVLLNLDRAQYLTNQKFPAKYECVEQRGLIPVQSCFDAAGVLTGNRASINFDPVDTGTPTRTAATATNEIRETDFVDFRQIRIHDPARFSSRSNDIDAIETAPADTCQRELRLPPIASVTFGVISNQVSSIDQLQYR